VEWGGGGGVEWGEGGGGSGIYCGTGSQPSKQNREACFICGDYPNYHQAHRYIYHHINHHTSFFIYHHICHQTFHHTATSPLLLPFPNTFHPPAPLQSSLHPLLSLLPACSSTDPTVRPDARAPVDGLPQLWLPLLGHLHSHVEVLE